MFKNLPKSTIDKFINKTNIILVLIILIGAFLRLYNFEELLRLNNDQVRDIQIVEQIKNGESIYLGPKAGGTKFNLGPAFYYLEYLSGLIFGFSPAGIAFFIPLLSIASIYIFYLLFKKIFSQKITLALTFLYAISFFALKYSHFAWNPNATPFFVLSFLLLIHQFRENQNWKKFFLLGLIIGIGTQLHTTLLVTMPIFTFLALSYFYFKEKVSPGLKNILILFSAVIILNLSFIWGDFVDNGGNIKEFFAGTQTKTNRQNSIIENLLHTAQFFLQGTAYHLIGIEPQKNWLRPIKLLQSKNLLEISLWLSSLIFFISGFFLMLKNKFGDKKNQNPASVLFSFFLLNFLMLIPLGDELNIRFFIIFQFLPYLILGFIIKEIFKSKRFKKIKLTGILIVLLLITASNLNIFKKTYDLQNYSAPESAYGGISLGELENLCFKIKDLAVNNKDKIYIENFEFKRSLEYICKNQNIDLNFLSQSKITTRDNFFVIIENKNLSKNIDRYATFSLDNSIKINRFTLLFFDSGK
ncbi:MAG: glycosyltransferase family 39 protein [Candidatus Moraniibacteriota bacterium]